MDAPIFDGHNDTLLNLYLPERGGGRSFFNKSETGHLDLPRAREGNFGGGLFACYVPNPDADNWSEETSLTYTETGYDVDPDPALDLYYARRVAGELAGLLFRIEAKSGGQLKVVRTADELAACLQSGVLAAVLHFEGAENLGPEPGALEEFYAAGLRSLGIVWSRPNAYGHGVPFGFPRSPDTGPGLTDAGRELVRACNRLGVLIDVSHLNERGFWDVAKVSEAPLVASHSNAHSLCPISRNLTDRQLDAIRDSDGLVGVNFAVTMLREDGMNEADTPLEKVTRHLDYLVERLGIERVGFGSDFDGAVVPQELGDTAGLPRLLGALYSRGYDEPALRKLTHENWLRVLRKSWQPATGR